MGVQDLEKLFDINQQIKQIDKEKALALLKIDMTELVSLYIKENKVSVFPLHESWIDIGSHDDYKRAQNI